MELQRYWGALTTSSFRTDWTFSTPPAMA
ncbi:hypothetical protein THIOKS11920011 [Thiocapsa sp. KS1]|nr:hypothetical protein THIOKS11920011 [Thiocapsa sp. KS1]